MFHDPTKFAFTARLEESWRAVRSELDGLADDDFFDWYQPGAHQGSWRICGLHAVDHPEEHRIDPDVVRRCPQTVELTRSIPRVHFGAFSLLGPHTILHPHMDGGPRALRCHLGVKIPPRCVFQVGDQRIEWEEGRCLVFDGSIQHAAWNHSNSPRVVLLVDFSPPELD